MARKKSPGDEAGELKKAEANENSPRLESAVIRAHARESFAKASDRQVAKGINGTRAVVSPVESPAVVQTEPQALVVGTDPVIVHVFHGVRVKAVKIIG